ncbi:MAG: hypothetical protein QM764_20570 [Chitinophagaceae bacterium]
MLFSLLSSGSIFIAAIIGLIRFRDIHQSYWPFVFVCWLAFLNEVLSWILIYTIKNNDINNNIYVIVEMMLYLWLFRGWGQFNNKKRSYVFTIILLWIVWIVENILFNHIFNTGFWFVAIYSITLVFVAINEINLILMTERGSLIKNSRFLISLSITFFYTYYLIIAIFFISRLHFSAIFYSHVYSVLQAVNIFINLVYAFAMLWAPRNQRFILSY